MTLASALLLALLLDAIFGEPKWLWSEVPHPAVLMGRLVSWCDGKYNTGNQRLNGVLVMIGLIVIAVFAGWVLSFGGWLVEAMVAAILLAQKSLVEHVRRVAAALRVSLGDGRRAVAMIVGRDTDQMDDAQVARAAIESAAENLSDGVVAPAFWFLVGGLPGLFVYKLTNTADSMIGHRTPRHEAFGWAAARFDDLLNLIPARLTAALIALAHRPARDRDGIALDARRHRSPNAGWPEAAMARALNVALSGPRSYGGEVQAYPFVNPRGKQEIGAPEIDAACDALWRSWVAMVGLIAALAVVLCLF